MQLGISLPPATFFVLTLSLLLHPISTGSHHGSKQVKLQKRLEEVFHRFSPLVTKHATLRHGDDCISPYEEKLRQQIVEELHVIATGHATLLRLKDAINKMEKFISMNDKELCNYRLTLVCDQELRKCVCGPHRVNVSFVWEGDKCHYAEGSMCMANSKIECSHETRCISMFNLDECTSGPCFCQREYYPTTPTTSTTAAPTTTAFVQIPVDDFDDDDSDDSEDSIPPAIHENAIDESVISTRESFKEVNEVISSEEDDDDDKVDGEEEQVIVVHIGGMEKPPAQTTAQSLPQEEVEISNEIGRDDHIVGKATAIPSHAVTSPAPTRRQELTTAIRRLEREVESAKRLGFGDECASINEESNYGEYRRLVSDMDCVTGENDEENLLQILGKLESILESGNMLCNWTLHLQCSGQSKKCECRTSSEDLDGFYLLFMEESRRCVLVENSRCLSQEYLISRKSPYTEIPCASETKCIAEETKADCKTKIENCFCRKTTPKPTEATKQKKSRSRGGKTSSATSSFAYFADRLGLHVALAATLLIPWLLKFA